MQKSEAGLCLVCLKNKEHRITKEERLRGRIVERGIRGIVYELCRPM